MADKIRGLCEFHVRMTNKLSDCTFDMIDERLEIATEWLLSNNQRRKQLRILLSFTDNPKILTTLIVIRI